VICIGSTSATLCAAAASAGMVTRHDWPMPRPSAPNTAAGSPWHGGTGPAWSAVITSRPPVSSSRVIV
jgi:hypothetical protein